MAFYSSYLQQIRDALLDSTAIQELKVYYNSLDEKTQQIVNLSITLFVTGILFFFPIYIWISTSLTKSYIRDIETQTDFLNTTASEIQELRKVIAEQSNSVDTSVTPNTPLKEIAIKYLSQSNVREDSYQIQESVNPDTIGVILSKISLRQVIKLFYYIESSPAGLEFSDLSIDTKSDPKGYLWMNLNFKKVKKH